MHKVFTKLAPGFQLNRLNVQEGKIEAVITSFGNADVVNDVIKQGALDDFIKNFTGALPMLFMHDAKEIIGEWTKIAVRGDLVVAEGQIFPEVTRGSDTMALISRGQVGATSIGFTASEYKQNDLGGFDFEKIDLVETSIVARPANPKAEILSAKREDGSVDLKVLGEALRNAGLTHTESKALLAGGQSKLRNAVSEELRKDELYQSISQMLGEI